MPPGMDPSFLFRSPLFSDAENNNLMAQAAAAEKARAIMMMNAAAAGVQVRPPGPLPPPLFPNPSALAALAASSANTTTASSLPQLPPGLSTSVTTTVNTLNPAIFSHYAALHQAALRLDNTTPVSSVGTPSSPTTLTRPLFPVIPPMRFSPYVVPPMKRSSPSPPQENRSSPIVSLSDRAESEASS